MPKQAFIVTGLGYGDEGKGSVVDWLTVRHNAHTVIRTGGPQALHRVVASDGREHVFQQFGAGTLRGAATHLSKHMLVAPHALLREALALQKHCQHYVCNRLTIHRDALVVTPMQAAAGRIRELLRGEERRGSVGVGVGETVRDSEDNAATVLHVRDLATIDLPKKLYALSKYKRLQYEQYTAKSSGLSEHTRGRIRAELDYLFSNRALDSFLGDCFRLKRSVRIVDDDYVRAHILGKDGTVIIEGSQGVLLDRVHGFYPYTTKVRATPETGREILSDGNYDGQVTSLGVIRSYATRHGRGPFVTEDAMLTKQLPDVANKNDPWQTEFRVGHFDAVAIRYAATACGADVFDGLVVTCVDRTAKLEEWSVCTAYKHEPSTLPNGDGALLEQTKSLFDLAAAKSNSLSKFLSQCQPVLHSMLKQKQQPLWSWREQQAVTISSMVGVPLYAVSTGETEHDKYELSTLSPL